MSSNGNAVSRDEFVDRLANNLVERVKPLLASLLDAIDLLAAERHAYEERPPASPRSVGEGQER